MDTKQVLEEEIHFVVSDRSIVQTDVNLNYTMTETTKDHRSSPFASSKQTLKETSVQFELLQESADVTTVQKHAQQHALQGKLFRVTRFYVCSLLLEEGNNCFFNWTKFMDLCMSSNLHCKKIGMKVHVSKAMPRCNEA